MFRFLFRPYPIRVIWRYDILEKSYFKLLGGVVVDPNLRKDYFNCYDKPPH